MVTINKEDFELLPTKLSIARVYVQQLALIAKEQHCMTHEQIYEQIEAMHLKHFNKELPFASFDSFRKYLNSNKRKAW